MNEILRALAQKKYEKIVVFTGAGMSAESGIPTYRSGSTSFWGKYKPAELATQIGWRRQKSVVWAWYESRRYEVAMASPNEGHLALAELQRRMDTSVITQNVDDLHERAGTTDVLHLHGSLFKAKCFACSHPYPLSDPVLIETEELIPPRCPKCRGFIRPAVVWFGEDLDRADFEKAKTKISQCDLLIVIGTSGIVQPAAGLVNYAPGNATLIEVNPVPATEAGQFLQLKMPVASAMPLLLRALTESS